MPVEPVEADIESAGGFEQEPGTGVEPEPEPDGSEEGGEVPQDYTEPISAHRMERLKYSECKSAQHIKMYWH